MTTGSSVDLHLLATTYPTILLLLSGLLVLKTATITAIGPRFGSQPGGERAHGIPALAGGRVCVRGAGPGQGIGSASGGANRVLIIVVVLSMALTPLLNEAGKYAANAIEQLEAGKHAPVAPGVVEAPAGLSRQTVGKEDGADGMLLASQASSQGEAGLVLPSLHELLLSSRIVTAVTAQ